MSRRLNEFVTTTLSALYLDVAKDPLYAGGVRSDAIRAVLDRILSTLTSLLAPILPHLAEDIHWYRDGRTADPAPGETVSSVFTQGWQPADPAWYDPQAAEDMRRILRIRSDVYTLLTQCKNEQYVAPASPRLVKSAPECAVDLLVSDDEAAFLAPYLDELADVLLVASVCLHTDVASVETQPAAWRR